MLRTRHHIRQSGFTLVELMIVVLIIGILAAIAIPNYVNMKRRAQESTIKSNMHILQLSVEDFAVQNESFYPTTGASSLPDGRTLAEICPGGDYPTNPFTDAPSVVQWNANPTSGQPGELALNPALIGSYLLKGNNPSGDTLTLQLTSGQ